jgi:hypothetical protein
LLVKGCPKLLSNRFNHLIGNHFDSRIECVTCLYSASQEFQSFWEEFFKFPESTVPFVQDEQIWNRCGQAANQ